MWCGKSLLTNQELLAVWYGDGRWLDYGKRKAGDIVNQLREDDPEFQKLWTQRSVTIEHILPRSLGGANHPDNYGAACIPCNSTREKRGYNDVPIPEFSGNPNGVHRSEVDRELGWRASKKLDTTGWKVRRAKTHPSEW